MLSAFVFLLQVASSTAPLIEPTAHASNDTASQISETKKDSEVGVLHTAEDRIADYTLFLAFSTVALVGVAWWQGRQLRRTVDQMKISEERQLRAYVFIHDIQLIDRTVPMPQTAGYRVKFKNSGLTPAYRVMIKGYLVVGPVEAETQDIPLPESQGGLSRSTLAPGGETTQTYEQRLDANQLALIHAGTHQLYFAGTIRYRDAFSRERHTDFRYIRDAKSHDLPVCEEGNDSN